MNKLLTVTDLARAFGEPHHVINHALKSYGPEPNGRIGLVRVWTPAQLTLVRASLDKTAQKSTKATRKTG